MPSITTYTVVNPLNVLGGRPAIQNRKCLHFVHVRYIPMLERKPIDHI